MSEQYPTIEVFTERAKLVAGVEQTADLLIRLTPPQPDVTESQRPKLNLSIVLDRSGSMAGAKIEQARQAAAYCVDQLLPTDRLSVVIFDEVVELLIPSQLVENKAGLKETLAGVQSRGSTALHEAWVRGGMVVSEQLAEDGINRVLLITDGLANVGLTNTDQIVSQAMELFRRGVSTSTIGIGADFNENLLMPMAQSAGGNSWHVEHADDMQRIFAVELEGLIGQFAHTVTLGLVPADGVRIADVLNDFEITETGRYRLPNLQAGLPLEVVVQLRVPAQTPGTKLRLLDLRVGYTRQDAKSAEVVKHAHVVEFASQSDFEHLAVNYEVVKAVRLLMNARARREAMGRMDAGDFTAARNVVDLALSMTQASCAPFSDSPEVVAECASLQSLKSSLKHRSEDKMSRKQLAYAVYERQTGKRRNPIERGKGVNTKSGEGAACPRDGCTGRLETKQGRYRLFLRCSNFPDCSETRNL